MEVQNVAVVIAVLLTAGNRDIARHLSAENLNSPLTASIV